jgi:hypothetical protein
MYWERHNFSSTTNVVIDWPSQGAWDGLGMINAWERWEMHWERRENMKGRNHLGKRRNYLFGAEHCSRGLQLLGHSIVSQHCMEPEGLIPNSRELCTCSYPEPDQSPSHLSKICLRIIHAPTSGFPTNNLYAFLFSSFVLHAPPISSSSTWSFWLYLAKSTNHEAVFSHSPVTSSLFGPNILLRTLF